jgi:hypothetical protein
MSSIPYKRITVLALFSLALWAFWGWRDRVAARKDAQQALYVAYVDGPLNEYCLALTRAHPLLEGKPAPEIKDALRWAQASQAELQALLATAPESECKDLLQRALIEHQALLAAIPLWRTAKKSALENLSAQEEQERGHLLYVLESLRYVAFNQWRLDTREKLETNAYIYSLKELSTKPN